MNWDEEYDEEYVLEDMGNEGEDILVTIVYIEEKNGEEVDVRNYLNSFVERLSSSRTHSVDY